MSQLTRDRRERLVNAPVGSTLLKLAFPMMAGIVAVVLFNIVDTFFVARLGADELAALSFTFPAVFAIMSITMGLGVGLSALVANAIGEENLHQVRRLTFDGLALVVALIGPLALLGIWSIPTFFGWLNAPPELIPLIADYMSLWYLGAMLLIIPMVGNAVLRATGDTVTPSVIMIIAGVINVILDPLLIFGIGPFPRLELAGAAWATVIAYAITFCASLYFLIIKEKLLVLDLPSPRELMHSWGRILHIGAPSAATQAMIPIFLFFITKLVAQFGPDAVAALGVGSRIESLALIGLTAMASVLTPFIGQNLGANKYNRVRQAFSFTVRYSLVWGMASWIVLMLLGPIVARAFSNDVTVQDTIILYLQIVPLAFLGIGWSLMASSAYNAMKMPFMASLLIVVRLFGLALPLSYIGAQYMGLTGLLFGLMAGRLLGGVLSFIWGRLSIYKRTQPTEHSLETASVTSDT